MALWCEGCPTVEVRRETVPKPITLVLPFYQAHRFFAEQRRVWRHYDPVLWPYLRIIVVDDGSPTPLAKPDDVPVSLRLFRIDVDVPWNWLAARNIGAHRAEDG